MRPAIIVQIVNVSLLLVWYLACQFVFGEVRLLMFFVGFQALLNLAACLIFYLDSKKRDNQLVYAFLIGFGIFAVITFVVWRFIFNATIHLPGLDVPA